MRDKAVTDREFRPGKAEAIDPRPWNEPVDPLHEINGPARTAIRVATTSIRLSNLDLDVIFFAEP